MDFSVIHVRDVNFLERSTIPYVHVVLNPDKKITNACHKQMPRLAQSGFYTLAVIGEFNPRVARSVELRSEKLVVRCRTYYNMSFVSVFIGIFAHDFTPPLSSVHCIRYLPLKSVGFPHHIRYLQDRRRNSI